MFEESQSIRRKRALNDLYRLIELLPTEHRGEVMRLCKEVEDLLHRDTECVPTSDAAEVSNTDEVMPVMSEAPVTLSELREEIERLGVRRLIDSVAHLSTTLTATRTRQEVRSIQAAAMAFSGLAHDIDELVLHREPQISDVALVLQEKVERAYAESGIVRFAPRVGELYDKKRHKALESVPTCHDEEDQTIAEVHRRGYEQAERVLSPALVTIKKLDS